MAEEKRPPTPPPSQGDKKPSRFGRSEKAAVPRSGVQSRFGAVPARPAGALGRPPVLQSRFGATAGTSTGPSLPSRPVLPIKRPTSTSPTVPKSAGVNIKGSSIQFGRGLAKRRKSTPDLAAPLATPSPAPAPQKEALPPPTKMEQDEKPAAVRETVKQVPPRSDAVVPETPTEARSTPDMMEKPKKETESERVLTKQDILDQIERVDAVLSKTDKSLTAARARIEELTTRRESTVGSLSLSDFQSMFDMSSSLSAADSVTIQVYTENRRKSALVKKELQYLQPHWLKQMNEEWFKPLYTSPSDCDLHAKNRARFFRDKQNVKRFVFDRRVRRVNQQFQLAEEWIGRDRVWMRKADLYEHKTASGQQRLIEKQAKQSMYHQTQAIVPQQMADDYSIKWSKYVDRNGLVEDPKEDERRLKMMNPWSEKEKNTFKNMFEKHPKNFRKIAKSLPLKSINECVTFYYVNKMNYDFKKMAANKASAAAEIFRSTQETVDAAPSQRKPSRHSKPSDNSRGKGTDSNRSQPRSDKGRGKKRKTTAIEDASASGVSVPQQVPVVSLASPPFQAGDPTRSSVQTGNMNSTYRGMPAQVYSFMYGPAYFPYGYAPPMPRGNEQHHGGPHPYYYAFQHGMYYPQGYPGNPGVAAHPGYPDFVSHLGHGVSPLMPYPLPPRQDGPSNEEGGADQQQE